MKYYASPFLFAAAVAASAVGCDAADKQTRSVEPTPTAASISGDTAATLSPEMEAAMEDFLGDYEAIRVLLVGDTWEGVEGQAREIAGAARTAAEGAPADLKVTLEGLATAADALAEVKGEEDLGAARKAYGRVSRHVVALLVAWPTLREGRFVFECPMAQGYQKWVQHRMEEINNPYMGQSMPKCGMKSRWES